MEKELTKKETLFCQEYTIDYNGAAAARRAGYTEKSAAKSANKLLKRPEVMSYVRQLQKEQAERLSLSRDLVVIKTLELLDMCMAAKPVLEWDYSEHCMVEKGTYEVDSKGANQCLDRLAKHLGMTNGDGGAGETAPVYFVDDMPEADNG